ncbi:MAG: flagellar hook-length control protein FliK [Planctomycetes bacterium]|nr:flagellar hook-length control protein FliK [Planctomycetota bacterium]
MDTSLLANTFLADPGGRQASLRDAATVRRRQSPATRTADQPETNAPTAATPDNPPPPVKGEPNQQLSKEFSRTLDKKMRPNVPQDAQDAQIAQIAKKGDKKGAEPKFGSGVVQAAISIPVVLDKATIPGAEAKLQQQIPGQTLDKSAPLTAPSGTSKAAPVVLKAPSVVLPDAKPLTAGPDQAVLDTAPTTDADPGNPELIAPAVSGAKSQDGADSEPMQLSDKTFAPKELLPDTAAGDQGEPVADKKPVITGEPAPSPHTQVEAPAKAVITSLHSAQANQSDAATIDGSTTPAESSPAPAEQLPTPTAPSTGGNTAAQLPNSPSAAPEDQASHSPQYAPIRSEKPLLAAKQTTPEKAVIDHKPLPDKMELPDIQLKNTAGVGTVPVKSIAQKAAQPGIGSYSSQTDNPGSLPSSGDGPANAESGEQAVVGNIAPGNITEQSPAAAESARPAANADSHPSVVEQIMEPVRTSFSAGSRQIVIQLNPPELGKVNITFREGADGITGLLQVDEPQTRHQLQQALPEIIQNLQNSGVQIKRLDVELTDQQQQYNPKDQSATAGQDAWTGQQSSSNFQSHSGNSPYNEWLTNNDPATEFAEARMQFADSSINMLV